MHVGADREAVLNAVLRALPDLCFRLDGEGRLAEFLGGNPALLYREPPSFLGKRLEDILPRDVAARIEAARRAVQALKEIRTVDYSLALGDALHSFEARLVPFGDNECIGVVRDLTDKVRTEEALRGAEERLLASQKMEAIGRLAGGVAHDFNNLLTIIIGTSEVLERRLGVDNPLSTYAAEISRAAHGAASLTRQLLAFSRKQVLSPKLLDPTAIVQGIGAMLGRLAGETIELTMSLEADSGLVLADPSQFEQVIVNLTINACDAMPNGGKLRIATRRVEVDEAEARGRDGASAGSHVALAIEDTGSGMAPEVTAHLFEPFFTTKPRGKGTGLGLATVYGIVKQSGGHITVRTTMGQGTRFEVLLPRVEGTADAPPVSVPPPALLRGRETILLVEDEDGLRQLVAEILEGCGYTVYSAARGVDAIRISERRGISLLVSDVVMPDINGRDLWEQIRSRHPDTRVLFMSGYDDSGRGEGAFNDFIAKPFTASVLTRRVREVLDRQPRA
jgi:two-component system cell cycle sensor histidine kinase/response regulator CckA